MPRPCNCGRVSGPTLSNDQCQYCWLWEYSPPYRELWAKVTGNVLDVDNEYLVLERQKTRACEYRGEKTRTIACGCSTPPIVFLCHAPENDKHECTLLNEPPLRSEPGLPACTGCLWRKVPAHLLPRDNPGVPEFATIPDACFDTRIQPRWFHLIDGSQLKPGADVFNGSLIRYREKLLMAYRYRWGGAEVRFAELDHDLIPTRDETVAMPRLLSRNSRATEDPRLFAIGDELWMATNGYGNKSGYPKGFVSMQIGRTDEAGTFEKSHWANYSRAREWEKNWGFFPYAGGINAIYQVAPTHCVLRSDEKLKTWHDFHETPFQGVPHLGLLRGGAMPVRHGDQWYAFGHTILHFRQAAKKNAQRFYTVGLYTFSCEPPFAPQRVLPFPLLLPCRDRDDAQVNRIVFVCGAFLENGHWIISGGWQDKRIFVAAFDANEVENHLEAVS